MALNRAQHFSGGALLALYLGAEMFAELGLGEGCQSHGRRHHHHYTLGILNMDMVPHARMIKTELPKLFFFFFLYQRSPRGKGKAHPQRYFWGGRAVDRAIFSRIYFTN